MSEDAIRRDLRALAAEGILAGILGEGTEAASEVVSNPAYLDAMLQKTPKNWEQLNLDAVIEANVIEGHPGPPTVVAVETW